MLPAHLAENIRKQILFYLQSTFDFHHQDVEDAFNRFLNDPESGMFKGPWVQLKRPFRPADINAEIPFDIDPGRRPFLHQWRAWKRLSSKQQKPQPTIVTTGTGSGKTECFLFPILDHCLRAKQQGQKGIKAIILYPMNALASDQEKRFAKTVLENAKLQGAGIRVGNYTGRYDPSDPGASADSGTKAMGSLLAEEGAARIYHGISNHAVQQQEPPDILLTNYKMLDFLLLRPQDQNLWRFNSPGVLQYLVMDELHTYDGAQGSDVACLIRRLKERLEIPKGELCFVGTSATLDDRDAKAELTTANAPSIDAIETGSDRLARFASTLFEEDITAESVIGEDRLTVEEIIKPTVNDVVLPNPADCQPTDEEDAVAYAIRQSVLWGGPACLLSGLVGSGTVTVGLTHEQGEPSDFAARQAPSSPAAEKTPKTWTEKERDEAHTRWAIELGEWLKSTVLFKYLLEIFDKTETNREPPLTWVNLIEGLKQDELSFREVKEFSDRSLLVGSFFALVAQAKELRSGVAFPLVPTQVQLWVRELRRLGRIVEERPVFVWLDEPLMERFSLPTFHCSECGESGWIALHDTGQDSAIQARGVDGIQLLHEPSKIYNGWFGHKGNRSQHIVVISPWPRTDEPRTDEPQTDEPQTDEPTDAESDETLWETAPKQRDLGFKEPVLKQQRLKASPRPIQQELGFREEYLCPASLILRHEDGPCPITGDARRFRVKVSRKIEKDQKTGAIKGEQGCPHCESSEGVFFIGSQSATLSSVAIDEMFGSVLNSDPKLLAFTDSVQDASHRAGFFSSRTYHFTFRTALQHVVDAAEEKGIPLPDVGRLMLEYWSQNQPQRQKNLKEAIASLMPPDLQQYPEWIEFRDQPAAIQPPKSLLDDIQRRLTWEATSEFGLMQTHGRSLEASGSSCIGWDIEKVNATIARLRQRLPGIDPNLVSVTDDQLQIWLLGWLHRFRIRGAVEHGYFHEYATKGFWGKYPFGRAIAGRETFPPQGHYLPKLMVTQREKSKHDFILAPTTGSRPPWHLVWSKRVLNARNLNDTAILDLIQALMICGEQAGLFRRLYQDGNKLYFAIAASAALLYPYGTHFVCSESGRSLIRPASEQAIWSDAPSLEYYADRGYYRPCDYTARQKYYQNRYRKGALRRVVSREHTGLLATEDREQLERDFTKATHSDDPNVLTCTSTLEMGIDIGDLSSTMLCSIPPTTASYLQRVGRAGRATGTALIVSIVNQRPHDLFFFGRPAEMLRGRVDPPGCWLDASAVLVRQHLAYCIDSATKQGTLLELPRSGRQLVEDLARADGHFPKMLDWITLNETDLRTRFLKRFQQNIQPDTRERFIVETATELFRQRIHQAANEFDRMRRDLDNARKRLNEQLKTLDATETETRIEIEQELHALKGRTNSLSRTSALEILTDNGLLPNYAFPERGVRFYGSIYNKHRKAGQDHPPIEIIRPAGTALKELAPGNHFYTHSRKFDIQQIAIGTSEDPLIESWAVCGPCGHMRKVDELKLPGTSPACPQCGHESGSDSQIDLGQHRAFVEFSRSQAMSQMEHYESLSGDRYDERLRGYYQTIRSFDLTADVPTGAVGDAGLPFGIEYRASAIMREINVGYQGETGVVAFGSDQTAPEEGFQICDDCGIAVPPHTPKNQATHRRSCKAYRKSEKLKQEGKKGDSFTWKSIYLYRSLKSEAIRLLLPLADNEDMNTLAACIHLGLRLRFEGNPAHLIVTPQMMPDRATNMWKYYLMLLDGVPGGTGYLKTLYQEKDDQQREGQGIMEVLTLARNALETCVCRKLHQSADKADTDGCYRCLRTYHLQYNAAQISRERGITLLGKLIEAGEKRVPQQTLDTIRPDSLFGSMLEKKFVDSLRQFVLEPPQNGKWDQTIIRGGQGFRFSFGKTDRIWELELQPSLGLAQGVSIPSRPDFLLHCDDEAIRPMAIFTDGFEFHVHPHKNLADDLSKRRAILGSNNYRVWSLTWDDLDPARADTNMVCHPQMMQRFEKFASLAAGSGQLVPSPQSTIRNGWEQLKGFLVQPHHAGWSQLANYALFWPLNRLADHRSTTANELITGLSVWRTGSALPTLPAIEGGDWVHNDRAGISQDLIAYIALNDAISNRMGEVIVLARLGDTDSECLGSDYRERWRRFLACLNLFQFCSTFRFWSTSEALNGTAPELPLQSSVKPDDDWIQISNNVTKSIRQYVLDLAGMGLPAPEALPIVEHYNDNIDDDAFAELAWPQLQPQVALLAGDQVEFAEKWQQLGWKVVVPDDLQAKGVRYLADLIQHGIDNP